MTDLFQALRTKYLSSGLSGKISDLYNTEAPANAVYPYGVMQLVSTIPDNLASDKFYIENSLIQFNLFDNSETMGELLEAYTSLLAAFDFADLIFTNSSAKSCVRISTMQTKIEGVWQINIVYRIRSEPT